MLLILLFSQRYSKREIHPENSVDFSKMFATVLIRENVDSLVNCFKLSLGMSQIYFDI